MAEQTGWGVAPVFRVRDVRKAVGYYEDQLGFVCENGVVEGVGDEGAVYGIVHRSGCVIHLGRARTGHEIDPGESPNAIGAYVFVEDVDGLYKELCERGAKLLSEPVQQFYGLRDFVALDLDGYHLSFGWPSEGGD